MNPPTDYRMFDYNVCLVPNAWIRDQEGTPAIGLSIGYPGWGLLYYAVMSHLHADRHNVILEIGTNYGASTIIMAQALIDSNRPGKIITIERDYATAEIAKEHFAAAWVNDYIRVLVGASRDVIPEIDTRIDIAFIDGSHDCPDVIDDFDNVLQLLNPGGLMIFDNTTMGGVNQALKIIRDTHGGNFVEFPCVSWSPAGIVFWKR